MISVIGERLADIRKDHGDTQQTLADKLQVSKFTVSNWEQEKSEPDHEILIKICRLYGISSDYLLGLSNIDPAYVKNRSEMLTPSDNYQSEGVCVILHLEIVSLCFQGRELC